HNQAYGRLTGNRGPLTHPAAEFRCTPSCRRWSWPGAPPWTRAASLHEGPENSLLSKVWVPGDAKAGKKATSAAVALLLRRRRSKAQAHTRLERGLGRRGGEACRFLVVRPRVPHDPLGTGRWNSSTGISDSAPPALTWM